MLTYVNKDIFCIRYVILKKKQIVMNWFSFKIIKICSLIKSENENKVQHSYAERMTSFWYSYTYCLPVFFFFFGFLKNIVITCFPLHAKMFVQNHVFLTPKSI